jgi:tetratricopeptide (TPR) repeat protein
LLIATFLLNIFAFLLAAFYTTGPTPFLIAGLTLGFSGSLLALPRAPVQRTLRMRVAIASPLILLGFGLLLLSSAQYVAYSLHEHGTVAYQSRDFIRSEQFSRRAAALWPASVYLQDAAYASFSALVIGPRLSDNSITLTEKTKPIVMLARRAVAQDPSSYTAWVALGTILSQTRDQLLPEHVLASSTAEAQAAFERAHALAPNRPEVFLAQYRLSIFLGENEDAQMYLEKASVLDPVYVQRVKTQLLLLKESNFLSPDL